MTVNERLHVSGRMGDFDEAVALRDVQRLRRVLTEVGFDDVSIAPILEGLGLGD